MSITLRVIQIIDRLKLQNYFVEKDDRIMFAPIRISLNEKTLERKIDKTFKLKGRPYQADEFEVSCLKDLDF